MDDVVVDTNILAHSGNPSNASFDAARHFLLDLLRSSTAWCMDPGFSLIESQNRSRILSEYLATVPPTDLGLQVLARLAATGRITIVDRPTRSVRGQIRRLVPGNPGDRVFVEVAYGSTDHVLVSHDESDFHPECRAQLRERLGVIVLDAATCRSRFV